MEVPLLYHTWYYRGRVGQDLKQFSCLCGAFYEDVEIVLCQCIGRNSEMFHLSWFPQDGAWTTLAPNQCCIPDFFQCGCMGHRPQARWEVGVHRAGISGCCPLLSSSALSSVWFERRKRSPHAAVSLGRNSRNYGRFGARSVPSRSNQCHQHLLPLSPDFNIARHPTLIVFEGAARHRKGIECFDEISRHFPGSC